ncbi:MAG: bifunctional UDP-N-acetylglucosamine diphosphorylase/glucosamine-1-phosphate N-acetyltransferase GlmU [Gammaproteobacteria bacterium]
MNLHTIILAAGKGTRMHTNLPKVMQPLAGKPMIDHVITTAATLANKISTVIGYKKDVLNEHLSANFKNVETFVQPELNGTAGAVKAAQKNILNDEDVLILYGDVPLISHETLKKALNDNHDAVILTMIPKDPFGYGRVIKNDSGLATEIIEEKDASTKQKKINEVFTGIMITKGEILLSSLDEVNNNNAAGEYYLTDVIKIASKKGVKINPIVVEETEVLGANTKSELHEIENIFREMKSKDLLEQGITLSDASRVDVRGGVSAGKDCSIDVNVILEGEIKLGTNVSIGPNCYLKDVVIGDNASIEAFSHIVSTQIGADCNVGPYARLREGTVLEDRAKIGNFVETKKTKIGKGSKANHLAYLGDAEVGKDSNIGAGTITCNYDGTNKHKTKIGNKTFVGTNSSLVAPLNIGDNSYIGAGSVITKDVEDDALAVARGKQSNKSGWAKNKK